MIEPMQAAPTQGANLLRALHVINLNLSASYFFGRAAAIARQATSSTLAALSVAEGIRLRCIAVSDSETSSQQAETPAPEQWPILEIGSIALMPLVVADTRHDQGWPEIVRRRPAFSGARSYTRLPLTTKGQIIGLLELGREEPLQAAVEELEGFAEGLAMALQHARALADYEAQVRRATVRGDVAARLAASTALEGTLPQVMEMLGQALDLASCALYLRPDEGGLLPAAMYPAPQGQRSGALERALDRVVRDVLAYEHPIVVDDTAAVSNGEELEADTLESLRAAGVRAILAAPLQPGGAKAGILLAAAQRPIVWADGDAALLEAAMGDLTLALRRGEALQRASEEAAHQERERLAREIHDTLAQTITGVVMQLDAVVHATPPDVPWRARLEQASAMARSAMAETRRAVWNLRPSNANLQVPRSVVQEEMAKLEQRTGIRAEVIVTGQERQIVPDVGAVVQRLVRVCLENIWTHSGAKRVRIRLDFGLQTLTVLVEDDGRGFDPEAIDLRGDGRVGLAGVGERARLIGGSLRVESAAGQGTRVQAELPYTPAAPAPSGEPQPSNPPAMAPPTPSGAPTRVVLIDDHTVVREGLARMLQDQPDLQVVGTAATGADGLRLIADQQPDVVLCDLQLPDFSGVQVISRVRTHFPDIRCLVLTTYDNDDYIYEGIKAGARGYVLKDVTFAELVGAVRAAARNESLLQPVVARKLVERFGELARQGEMVENLTEREAIVLKALGSGLRNKEIAFQLGLSESTVKTHLASIFGKLNVTTRTEAVARGRELGIISL